MMMTLKSRVEVRMRESRRNSKVILVGSSLA